MKNKTGKVTLLERYFTKEIGIELKACLYFFAILFYYCCYRLHEGIYVASILHMAEMILIVYLLGYVQTFLLWNFDEGETVGLKEILSVLGCTIFYGSCSYFLEWFDCKPGLTIGFVAYVLFMYSVMIFIMRYRRVIDEKILNEELDAFKRRNDE